MTQTSRVLAALFALFFALGAFSTAAVASPGADGNAAHHEDKKGHDKDKDKKKDKDEKKDEDKDKDKDKKGDSFAA